MNNNKYLTGVNSYESTGGNLYILFIELKLNNKCILFAADEEMYSIYDCSYDEFQQLCDDGDVPPILKVVEDYITLNSNNEVINIDINLEVNDEKYFPSTVYNEIKERILQTICKRL